MKALITGSSGFIGSHLADELVRGGNEVIGIDRRHRSDAGHIQITSDLNDPGIAGMISSAAGWADVVFHLAARPGVRFDGPGAERSRYDDIVLATVRLLSVLDRRTHLVATSSSSVYGGARRSGDGWAGSREGDPLGPIGSYARRKAEMERLCLEWAADGGRLCITRPFTVVGERQRADMAVSLWLAAASEGRPVQVLGSLDRARDMTDVRAVASGLISLAEQRHEGIVNLGAGSPRTLAETLAAVFAVVGREVPIARSPASPDEVEATCADTAVATSLGIDLDTDLVDVIARQHAESARHAPRRMSA